MLLMQKSFIRYFKDNDLYERYMFYFNNRNFSNENFFKFSKKETFIMFSNNVHIEDFVRKAFSWRETKEGYSFWLGISQNWKNIVNPFTPT